MADEQAKIYSLTWYLLKQRMLSKMFDKGFPVFILYFLQTSVTFSFLNSNNFSTSIDLSDIDFCETETKPLK